MEFIIVCLVAMTASALTLFSGFGLGTLLMPVIAIFFPLETAIAMTAMVHLANNGFKVALLGKNTDISVLIRFGLPAILSAFVGGAVLIWLGEIGSINPVYEYQLFNETYQVLPIKLVIGSLIISFVIMELNSHFSGIAFNRKYLPLGGMISGFFGGLSGHQGAFRSMFLLKAGLTKEVFIATGIVIAIMVDLARMVIYGLNISLQQEQLDWPLIIAATLSAFSGAYFGSRLLKKVTIRFIRIIVSILLIIIALGMIIGVV